LLGTDHLGAKSGDRAQSRVVIELEEPGGHAPGSCIVAVHVATSVDRGSHRGWLLARVIRDASCEPLVESCNKGLALVLVPD
jgi:hypothetical protein